MDNLKLIRTSLMLLLGLCHCMPSAFSLTGGWVETDPTWVTPDVWEGGDGLRWDARYVLDSNFKTTWRRGDEDATWQLTFDLQTQMTLSRIRIWSMRELLVHSRHMDAKVMVMTGQQWTTVPHNTHFRGEKPMSKKVFLDLTEFYLTGLLTTGQLWRLEFPNEYHTPIGEVKFFQACSGFERTVCTDGNCDVHNVACDGIVDCDDGSDEDNCDQEICPSGAAINKTDVCDGTDDCGDNTDEQNCSASCDNGALFHQLSRCDGRDDCGDNSDEQNCVCYYIHDRGTSYRGLANRDNSCQLWTSQNPHPHNHTPQAYPRAGLEQNYCRNPDGKDRPWCYTNNPLIRWMYCEEVFACDAPPTRCFYALDKGRSYAGQTNRTRCVRDDQRWDSQSPHSHPHTPHALYTFIYRISVHRAGDRVCQRWDSQSPHSHTHTTQDPYTFIYRISIQGRRPGVSEMGLPVPPQPSPHNTGSLHVYIPYICTGQVTGCVRDWTQSPPQPSPHTTGSLHAYIPYIYRAGDRVCQRWDSQSPHNHPHTPQAHPDSGLEENFCRNPDNKERPWCYTTDPTLRWKYCDVMECVDPLSPDSVGQDCGGDYTCAKSFPLRLCYCDEDCSFFGDCCQDFETHGSLNNTTPLQNCSEPALTFTSEEFRVLPSGSVHLLGSNVSCTAEQVAILNTTASICGECILQYFSNYTQTASPWDADQGWLTLGLVIASAVAVFGYVVHNIRSGQWEKVPEKLKVQVLVCMAFAEVLFMVRVRVPLGSACAAFAIILHYFLLTAFTSMNALAVDLFLTFRDALERAKLYQYLLYTWLMPMPIVIVTVIVEFGSSVSVGYGENCWIGNPVANLLAFGVPVFSAILVNAVLATFVLLAIRKSFVIADKAKSRSSSSKAWVYLRISFLTGFTWILGFIYPYVNSRAVEYIFIVLNASQGLLLALMLTITSKVVKKWKVAIRERFGLAEANKDNRASTAAMKQRTTVTACETSSSADIPLTTFTDVEENRARIQLDSLNKASGCTATVSNRKTTVCATEMPKTTLADVEKTARSHLNKPQQDNGATAAASTKLASTGGTEADAGGSDVVAGGSDVVAGGTDVVAGGTDVVAGGTDVVAGGTDVVAGGTDVVAGGTDVVAGGIDVVAGGTDVVAGGTDVVVGGTDVVRSVTAPDIDEKETSF
uniref:G-protein coupled receptors family 2 profile 2 domain-containing protein n=1 Tax=Branchiostoma floridae TaxID=7739 RepID=C3YYN4_BRAFL|eukprot:XP_002598662.1 hypothetical protein BRAFLDRAFT_67063 [Branchiostoma floridae]